MKLDLYSKAGEKKGSIEASEALFNAPIRDEVVRLAVIRHLANARQANATVKTRHEVRGGGRKPWKQKGTGRARVGSIRSPLWRGGGILLGPSNDRNYSKAMNKKAYRAALVSSLSDKANKSLVFALEEMEMKKPSTKSFASLLKKLPEHRSMLMVIEGTEEMIEKSAANLPNVKILNVIYLNPYDILKYDKVVFLESALKKAEELFA